MKKYLLPIFILFSFKMVVIVPSVSAGGQGGWGVISEVALRESGPGWDSVIEIFVMADEPFDVGNASVYHFDHDSDDDVDEITHAYTFSTGTVVNPGDYLLLHFNSEEDDELFGEVKHFYSTYTVNPVWGLSDSQGAFVLSSTDTPVSWYEDEWVDFVLWLREDHYEEGRANRLANVYSTAAWRGHWKPEEPEDEWYEKYVAWISDRDGYSLQRKYDPRSGKPKDTNTGDDWFSEQVNLGGGYFEADSVTRILDVFDSPFYPYEGNPRKAKIGINNKENTEVLATVKIYNIEGYKVRGLEKRRNINAGEEMNFRWDGEDDNGDVVAMGIYVVHLTFEDMYGKYLQTAQETVVVGRRF